MNHEEPWRHQGAVINGLDFHYVEAGTGPLVVLLHGFPEFWYSWRRQLPVLAAAGFHVVAPDLRGYNESAKPAGVANYRTGLLASDVASFIAHVGAGRATVVGHDWGGVIAWQLAMRHPELVDRLVILNAPHPAAFRRELRNLRQWFRSWYILFFQLPWLPELVMGAGDYALLKRMFRRQPLHPDAFTSEDIRRYQQALAQPGARTATLNYYRAAVRYSRPALGKIRSISIPTLLIWGKRDPYLGVGLTQELNVWVQDLRVEYLDASHWVQNDKPTQVNVLLLEFLKGFV